VVTQEHIQPGQAMENGDVISFTLPMEFRMTRYEGAERDPET